jgi:Protein of unknown function (DUF4238)
MSVPRKHHFIPAFYQKAWADAEGTLVEYSRPRDIVKCRPKTPAATGWERDLYAFPELPPEADQHIEAQFFQYADDVAAQALANLLAGNKIPWTIESRSAGSRFLIAIHVRHPDAMKELRPAVQTIWDDSADASLNANTNVQDSRTSPRPLTNIGRSVIPCFPSKCMST